MPILAKTFLFLGSVGMLLAVALGAFGAHALKKTLAPDLMAVYETAVNYHVYHALGLLAVGLLVAVYHLHLGIRAIIEDYVHGSTGKLALMLNLLGCLALAGAGLAFIILIALAQAPAGA